MKQLNNKNMNTESEFNFIESIMLQHANPIKLLCDCTGIVLCIYFLWTDNLLLALILLFGFSILGNALVWKSDIQKLSETQLGKWMLGQAKPLNLVLRTIGFFIFLFGIWRHYFLFIVTGIIVIALARFFGSKKYFPVR